MKCRFLPLKYTEIALPAVIFTLIHLCIFSAILRAAFWLIFKIRPARFQSYSSSWRISFSENILHVKESSDLNILSWILWVSSEESNLYLLCMALYTLHLIVTKMVITFTPRSSFNASLQNASSYSYKQACILRNLYAVQKGSFYVMVWYV